MGAIVISYHKNVVMEPERWIQTLRAPLLFFWSGTSMAVWVVAGQGSVPCMCVEGRATGAMHVWRGG